MFKDQIISRFNKAAQDYDSLCTPQKESAKLLIKTLSEHYPNFAPQTILDLGTGTGILVEEMLKLYHTAHYSLNDHAENMLKECKKKFINYPNFSYLENDMQAIPSKYYDLVSSNFSLQWLEDPKAIISLFAKNCKIFAFTYVLQGTFSEWYQILESYNITNATTNFLPQEQLEKLCDDISSSCFYFTKNYELKFSNYAAFANYLKSIGASANDSSISISNLRKILKLDTEITTSYKVFFSLLVF